MAEHPLNLPERLLANELAELVAKKMDIELDRVDGEIYNIGQSNYECGCLALNLVGVYRQAQHYTRHQIVVPVERVAQHMSGADVVSRKAFDTLLSAFIENYITYGGGLSGYRSVVTVPSSLLKALKLLVKCGYSEQVEGGFRWTEKIAPTMQRWYIWDKNGICKEEQVDRREIATAAQLEKTIPSSVRRKLVTAMRSGDPRAPYRVLQKHLDGTEWRQLSLFRKQPVQKKSEEVNFRTINRFLRLFREKP
ncbi:hypothetical protein [Parasedimentitalea huanghaiensis]|uniref:Uncharacterized protein n=1 Tax=Parasedimentitalea huanghaiensis TaxID=2682100 RepID=A0A6L6WKK0_9RHOB|nr:hypothetical protein [Zongyanglinia huanghaiensis]MVO17115.1 hypothetical protein [Zongyanglinia huanghaiensis]